MCYIMSVCKWKFCRKTSRFLIFSYLPYKFILRKASSVCQAWRQIAYDKSLIKYARDEEFLETNARGSSTETLNYFLQAVQWRPSLFQSIDLSGAKATWETFRVIAHNCGELKILNMARIEGKISEYPLIQVVKIVELIITRKHLFKSGTQVSLWRCVCMLLINPQSKNKPVQKLIAKYVFDCYEKRTSLALEVNID